VSSEAAAVIIEKGFMSEKVIILASGSPRRRELLGLTGLTFRLAKADIDETPHSGEAAADYTLRLSREKARAVMVTVTEDALILAADTTVADGDLILGKPADPDEARAMLRRLRGRVHQVYTALTLLDTASGRSVSETAVTDVPMRDYSDEEIEAYIASGDPFDKAGGYAIQNAGFHPVTALSGCYANVVGLPLCHLVRALRVFGIAPGDDVPQRCQQHHAYVCDVTGEILARPG
jgi:septum formation protein